MKASVDAWKDKATGHETHDTLDGGEVDVDAAFADSGALDDLQDLLDGKAWRGAETLGEIAEILRRSGRPVRDLENPEGGA